MSIIKFKNSINGEYQKVWTMRGIPGPQGEKGNPGHTPVKGVDYWNEEDKINILNKALYKCTPVKYLENTGKQYIDTLVTQKQGHRHEVLFYPMNYSNNQWFYGTDNFEAGYYGSYWYTNAGFSSYVYNSEKQYYTVTGTVTQDRNRTCYVFARNHTTELNHMKGRIYGITIWDENGNVLYNFIPALDMSGVPCLFEKINHTYHYNIGDGEFVVGYFEEVNE